MIRKAAMFFTLVCLFTTVPGFAQVKLQSKLQEGKKLITESITTVDQTFTIAGNETETKVENYTTTESKVGKRDTDGTVPVTHKIKSLQINIEGTVGKYSFSSANPNEKGDSQLEMMRDVHKALLNRIQTPVHGKDNRVVQIKSDNTAFTQLPVQVQALVKSQFDSKHLKDMANQALAVLPSKPVKKGDSWERTEKSNFGAGQTMEFKTKYTYDGTIEKDGRKLDKISAKTLSVTFALSDDSPLPISLKDSSLKVKESKGVILFDRELGQIVASKTSLRIEGKITFEAGGQELPSELDITMRSEVTIQR